MMNETVLQPVLIEVSDSGETCETLSPETSISTPSEAFFNSDVGFLEAVKITGRNKGTISRDTKSGKLSCSISEAGQKRYKVADLYTLYGLRQPKETGFQNLVKLDETVPETVSFAVDLAVLKERLKAQDEMLRLKDAQIRDLQDSRDKLLEQNNRLTLLLPAPQEKITQSISIPSEKPSFWKRLFS